MNVLIFGVSCVGKSTIGELLAKKLNYDYYDLDDEVMAYYNMSIDDFIDAYDDYERAKKRIEVIYDIFKDVSNKIIAVTPLLYEVFVNDLLVRDDVFAIELQDTFEHIFDRLMFADAYGVIYKDDEYKNKHKDAYMEMINEDNIYFGKIFKNIPNKYYVDNKLPEVVVDEIIEKYINNGDIYDINK